MRRKRHPRTIGRIFQNLKELTESGWKIALVHGGGPDITKMLKKLNIRSEFVNGQRKTTKAVLEVAEMVLSGSINKFSLPS